MQCLSYPLLSSMGAYDPTLAVYTQEVMADIVNYGYERGIRVVVEFDVPGHAYSWGDGYPTIRAQCPASYASNINNYPLDPSQNLTFQVLQGLFQEMTAIFPDQYFHVGGDEVEYPCWTENPAIANWMKQMGFSTGEQVFNYFEMQLEGIMRLPTVNRSMVVWQDAFTAGISLPASTIVESWEDHTSLQAAVNAGFRGITAYGDYLDKQQPIPTSEHYEFEDTWEDFYGMDPTINITTNVNRVIGGEAAMWGEQVDDTCFDERVWPRASAVAERLWSAQTVTDTGDAKRRLEIFRCRVARRGINGGPLEPDFCPLSMTPPTSTHRAGIKRY